MGNYASNHSFVYCILILLALIFLNPTKSNDLDDKITEFKIKMITTIELSSMTFNELPNLFSLYEDFVRTRFKSIQTKKGNNNFIEFRKIHQFYAFKNAFRSFEWFHDVMVARELDIDELDILKNKINWTDQDVMKYGILTKDTNGNFKFNENEFGDFFIAEYFHDNIFQPVDQPTDAEMEMRLRFLFYIATNRYENKRIMNEFIRAMIEDQNREIFSDQVRMLMKYNFKYLLDSFLPSDLSLVEKISKLFVKDEEILKNLWGVDHDQPYFHRFTRFTSAADHLQELRKIAEKFFKFCDTELPSSSIRESEDNGIKTKYCGAEKIFKGKNQLVNIIYRIQTKGDEHFTKEFLEVTQANVSDEILGKLKQNMNFFDFVDAENFSMAEKREFYFENAEIFITNSRNGKSLSEIWERFEKYFNTDELKEIWTGKDITYNLTHLFLITCHDDLSYVETYLNLTQNLLNINEINDFLQQKSPITCESFLIRYLRIVNKLKIFETTWNFTKHHLNHDELKSLLFDNKKSDFLSRIVGNKAIFLFCMYIMEEFYTKDQIREMYMATNDGKSSIIFWAIDSSSISTLRTDFIDYLKYIFNRYEEKLKELLSARNIYGETILGHFKSNWDKRKMAPFEDLVKELFTIDEIKELREIKEIDQIQI